MHFKEFDDWRANIIANKRMAIDKYIPIKPRELNHWNLKNIME